MSGADPILAAHCRLALIGWAVRIGQGKKSHAGVIEAGVRNRVCLICTWTSNLASPPGAVWPRTIEVEDAGKTRKLNRSRGVVRKHMEDAHSDLSHLLVKVQSSKPCAYSTEVRP